MELTTLVLALAWSFKAGASADAPPLATDDRVFYAASDKKLYALNAADGQELWSRRFKAPLPVPPVSGDGYIYQYVPYPEGSIYALRPSDGKVIWKSPAGPGVVSAAAGGGIVAAGRGRAAVFYDLLTGDERGRVSFDDDVVGASYVGGESFVVWTGKGSVARCGPSGGDAAWEIEAAIGGVSAVAAGGRVYVGAASGEVACYDLETGDECWFVDTGERLTDAAPYVVDGVVMVAGRRRVFALSCADGEVRWTSEPGGNVVGAAPYAGGAVVACEDGRVVFAREGGGEPTELARLDAYAAAAPLVAEGRVYVTDGKKSLECYRFE
jgi:outer membrane protein assembly factor BamB